MTISHVDTIWRIFLDHRSNQSGSRRCRRSLSQILTQPAQLEVVDHVLNERVGPQFDGPFCLHEALTTLRYICSGARHMNVFPVEFKVEQNPNADPWVMRLRSENSSVRDKALTELGALLVRGLSRPMSRRYGGALQPEDIVQDALLKILDSLDQFAGRAKFTTWALTIAIRIGTSEMRRKHYQNVSIDAFGGETAAKISIPIDQSAAIGKRLDQQAIIQKLQRAIDSSLTPKQRFAIRASLEGVPVEVIAEKTGGNRNSIYKLAHDARAKLRLALEEIGITAADFTATFA